MDLITKYQVKEKKNEMKMRDYEIARHRLVPDLA